MPACFGFDSQPYTGWRGQYTCNRMPVLRRMTMFASLIKDVAYTVRSLRRTPLFTATAVLSLALGIGANTAIFSLIDQVLLRALPVQDPERLVLVKSPGYRNGLVWSDELGGASFTYPMYKDLRDAGGPLSGLVARFGF